MRFYILKQDRKLEKLKKYRKNGIIYISTYERGFLSGQNRSKNAGRNPSLSWHKRRKEKNSRGRLGWLHVWATMRKRCRRTETEVSERLWGYNTRIFLCARRNRYIRWKGTGLSWARRWIWWRTHYVALLDSLCYVPVIDWCFFEKPQHPRLQWTSGATFIFLFLLFWILNHLQRILKIYNFQLNENQF